MAAALANRRAGRLLRDLAAMSDREGIRALKFWIITIIISIPLFVLLVAYCSPR